MNNKSKIINTVGFLSSGSFIWVLGLNLLKKPPIQLDPPLAAWALAAAAAADLEFSLFDLSSCFAPPDEAAVVAVPVPPAVEDDWLKYDESADEYEPISSVADTEF